MKYLTRYKLFESSLISSDEANQLLDKISDQGLKSLSSVEKNRLKLYSSDDQPVIDIIEKMAEYTRKFKDWNQQLNKITDEYKQDLDNSNFQEKRNQLFKIWTQLNNNLRDLESSLSDNYGIPLGSHDLSRLMNQIAPDVYNPPII